MTSSLVLDRSRFRSLIEREREKFAAARPKSRSLFENSKSCFLYGVPMNWMAKWSTPFPVFAQDAQGARIRDIDGHSYLDLCLGDTAAFFGHSPAPLARVLQDQVANGITMMLPTEYGPKVGRELERKFGLPFWQVAVTATDANRFALRLAREVTRRHKVVIFNGAYHGSLVETLAQLEGDRVVPNADSVGPELDPATTTRVVEFNDIEGMEKALASGDVACVLVEPALTNCGLVLPKEGYHEALREVTRHYGSLLLVDETHTICAGPGGYTKAFGLQPDILTMGKPIGGGVPSAVFGFSKETAERIYSAMGGLGAAGIYAVGGTLAGNALSMRAIYVTLTELMTDEAYTHMFDVAERIELGVSQMIREFGLPWQVSRLGACVAYSFRTTSPVNGSDAMAIVDPELNELLHLYLLNKSIILTPFQCMAVVSPQVTRDDADLHNEALRALARDITSRTPAVSGSSPT